MPFDTNDATQLWQQGSTVLRQTAPEASQFREAATDAAKRSARSQFQTILVLTATLIVLALYFRVYLTREVPFATIGKVLMVGSLLGRIVLELFSIGLARKVRLTDSVSDFVRSSLRLIRYREKAIRWFAVVGGLTYTLGYFVLLYAYRSYPTGTQFALLVVGYFIAMAIVGYFIWRGYLEERDSLHEYEQLVDELSATEA